MFWANLASYIGPTAFGVHFIDGLEAQRADGYEVMMNVYDGPGPWAGDYVISDVMYPGALETVHVYFLPWYSGRATKVKISDLNASGCDYFTTSEFTGCRFVVTEQEIMHVAWSGGGGAWGEASGAVGTSALRSQAESNAIGNTGLRQRRRAISISEASRAGRGIKIAKEGTVSSYGTGPKVNGILPGKMKVFGYKVNNAWCFKTLKYEDESRDGDWENFD